MLSAVKPRLHGEQPGPRPRFGSALPLSPATRLFSFFETSYEPGFIFLSKIFGNILPRVAITRTWDERKEVTFNEATQTAGFFLTLPVASALFNPIQGKLAAISPDLIRMRNEEAFKRAAGLNLQRLKVAKLGKSFAVSAIIAWLMLAMPYIRNWRTTSR
jgi:hypothetical protein